MVPNLAGNVNNKVVNIKKERHIKDFFSLGTEPPMPPMRALFIRSRNILFSISSGAETYYL
jgi:hypothetical protein